jgi:hypothetical protein
MAETRLLATRCTDGHKATIGIIAGHLVRQQLHQILELRGLAISQGRDWMTRPLPPLLISLIIWPRTRQLGHKIAATAAWNAPMVEQNASGSAVPSAVLVRIA